MSDATPPAPARETRFWDRIAPGYAKRPVADQATYARKLDITRSCLTPEMEVLEFGCGTGSTALLHAPYVKHILGLDFSAQMIEIARDKARAEGIENISFMQNRIEDFEPPVGHYDAVLAMSILHLLRDPRSAIAKSFDMLKPGGRFFSSSICLGDGMGWFRPITFAGRMLRLLPLIVFFKSADLEQMMRDAGFEIEQSWQPGPRKGIFIVARKPG